MLLNWTDLQELHDNRPVYYTYQLHCMAIVYPACIIHVIHVTHHRLASNWICCKKNIPLFLIAVMQYNNSLCDVAIVYNNDDTHSRLSFIT